MAITRHGWRAIAAKACFFALAMTDQLRCACSQEPMLEDLCRRIEVLSPDNETLSSFHFKAEFPFFEAMPTCVEVAWSRTDGCGVLVTDAISHTPIALHVDGQGMVYDPIKGKLRLVPHKWSPSFQAKATADKLTLDFYPVGRRGKQCEVDLASFLDEHIVETASRTIHDGKIAFAATTASGKSNVVATFAPEGKFPLESLNVLTTDDEPKLVLAITVIAINKPVPDRLLRFPDENAYKDLIDVDAVTNDSLAELLNDYLRAYLARGALADPTVRSASLLKGVDWQDVCQRDVQAQARLQKLFGLNTL